MGGLGGLGGLGGQAGGGGEGRSGYSTKNKNPTRQCWTRLAAEKHQGFLAERCSNTCGGFCGSFSRV